MQKMSTGKFHFEPPSRFTSLDHFVGGDEQLVGHSEAEHSGGLVVDDQLELAGLYDWQVRGFRALEDATGIIADLTIHIHNVASVGHQPAGLGKFTVPIYRGEPVAPRQEDELDTPSVEECVVADEEGVGALARNSREGRIDLAAGAGVEDLDL